MVSDAAAAERMVDRLVAVWFDEDVAFAYQLSRGRLAREFVRRTALWAVALGVESSSPFADLAGALDPEVSVDPRQLARLEIDSATCGLFPIRPEAGANIARWAALGDLPRQRFPDLPDPYEPLLAMYDRGGGGMLYNGFLELGYGAFPLRTLPHRAALEQLPIDEASLNAKDEQYWSELDINLAKAAEARALLAAWWNARRGRSEPAFTADSFLDWQVSRRAEFLLFGPPSGFGNQLFLVGDGVVKPFSYATDSPASALTAARAERSGAVKPDPPQRSPF
jgi:hypothetical protein